MLITNFAAGELSETLFGRTDLAQYYQGCSRLENFDVVPTGGITRRQGMKRLRKMDGNGRIIPFIVDRVNSLLLFLTPGKIQIFRGADLLDTMVSSESVPLYETMDEIKDVQYAQNYNRMILVHEDYAPLILSRADDSFYIGILSVGNRIKVHTSSNDIEVPTEYDDKYKSYLKTPGDYPRAVTFFLGRIVFASTKNNPQRIFASEVNPEEDEIGVFNFSTYAIFISTSREYISVRGELRVNSGTFVIKDLVDLGKFTEQYEEYYVASFYFEKGTMIAGIHDDTFYFTQAPNAVNIPPAQMAAFLDWKELREVDSGWSPETHIKTEAQGRNATNYYIQYKIGKEANSAYNIGYFRVHISRAGAVAIIDSWVYYNIDNSSIENVLASVGNCYNYVLNAIQITVTETANFNQFINDFFPYINNGLKYGFTLEGSVYTYYGTPERIYQQLLGSNAPDVAIDIYLSFYTVKTIEDKYPTPECGFTFEIASDMSDEIKWIAQNKNLLVGTETGEWVIPAGITATNVQAVLNSRYGSDSIQATAIGDAMCFFQTGKKALVEYYIPQQDNNFRANNMAMLSKNMLHESPAFDFDFISAPYTKIFVSREDGIVVSLLYERSTGTFAWGRITTSGIVKSVATIPGLSGYDNVYLIIERGGEYFLEQHSERIRSPRDNDEGVFLDSYREWDGNAEDYPGAVVYDETAGLVFPVSQPPIPGHIMWVGYPYTSTARSMPVLANDRMKPNVIKNLLVRFYNSSMPIIKSLPNGMIETVHKEEPYSGVIKIPFPGMWDHDVFFEFVHDRPSACHILAVNAEVN